MLQKFQCEEYPIKVLAYDATIIIQLHVNFYRVVQFCAYNAENHKLSLPCTYNS